MKTTVELPDDLFREAKATAARRGQSLKRFLEQAIQQELARSGAAPQTLGPKQWPVPPPDVPLEELKRIDEFIEKAFEQIDTED